MHDVANVRDGFSPQTNIVRQNGVRGTLISVIKNGGSSTIQIVDQVKQALDKLKSRLPPELVMTPLFDQSLFVRASIEGVVREALIAACLTAAMILLFLGNWRSTLIIAVSIPLSILVSVIVLSALGQTFNIMTLGGLALAVGHPGGRRDGGDREHRPQPRHGQGAARGDSRRRVADRGAGAGFDAVHLHRVRADVFPHRGGEVPVRAPGGGGGVRDAGVLSAFAHAGADAGAVPAEGA